MSTGIVVVFGDLDEELQLKGGDICVDSHLSCCGRTLSRSIVRCPLAVRKHLITLFRCSALGFGMAAVLRKLMKCLCSEVLFTHKGLL